MPTLLEKVNLDPDQRAAIRHVYDYLTGALQETDPGERVTVDRHGLELVILELETSFALAPSQRPTDDRHS